MSDPWAYCVLDREAGTDCDAGLQRREAAGQGERGCDGWRLRQRLCFARQNRMLRVGFVSRSPTANTVYSKPFEIIA